MTDRPIGSLSSKVSARVQIVVLATHRSGTSTVAGLIHRMGAYAGRDEELMAPTPDNPKGYWERHDVVNLNDRLLASANCSWDRIDAWRPDLPAPSELQAEIGTIIAALAAEAPFVVKDPRLCLTWPWWRDDFSQPVIVLVHRNPLEIARSLHMRDGMPMTAALALWEAYTVGALQAARGQKVVHVDYNKLITSPREEVASLHAALSAHGPLPPLDEAAISDFVSPELNRSQKAALDPAQWLTPHHDRLIALMRGEQPLGGDIAVSQASRAALREHAEREAARETGILLRLRVDELEKAASGGSFPWLDAWRARRGD